jgi:hypothetical protein
MIPCPAPILLFSLSTVSGDDQDLGRPLRFAPQGANLRYELTALTDWLS